MVSLSCAQWVDALEHEEVAKAKLSAAPLGRVLDPFVGGGAVPGPVRRWASISWLQICSPSRSF